MPAVCGSARARAAQSERATICLQRAAPVRREGGDRTPAEIVSTVKVKRSDLNRYKLELAGSIPKIAGGSDGTRLSGTISRPCTPLP